MNLIGLGCVSNQSLAVTYHVSDPSPNRTPLDVETSFRWRRPLAVVKVSHPKGVKDRTGDLIYKGDHLYKDEAGGIGDELSRPTR